MNKPFESRTLLTSTITNGGKMKKLLLISLTCMGLAACTSNDGGGQNPPPKRDCTLPWGGSVPSGQSVQAYKLPGVPQGQTCQAETRTCNDGVLSGSFTYQSCVVQDPVDTEPPSHHAPAGMSDDGLKEGTCIKTGTGTTAWVWSKDAFSPAPSQICPADAVAGQPCNGQQSCKAADGNGYFYCKAAPINYECYGWVYEYDPKLGTKKPMSGVSLDIYTFAGCLVGDCATKAGPVATDQWGYFSLQTQTLSDTLRIKSPAGYYGVCDLSHRPLSGGGTALASVASHLGSPFAGAFKQMKITESSCK